MRSFSLILELITGHPNIKRMVVEKDINGLSKSLHHGDWELREKAVNALGKLGASEAVDPILNMALRRRCHLGSRSLLHSTIQN